MQHLKIYDLLHLSECIISTACPTTLVRLLTPLVQWLEWLELRLFLLLFFDVCVCLFATQLDGVDVDSFALFLLHRRLRVQLLLKLLLVLTLDLLLLFK